MNSAKVSQIPCRKASLVGANPTFLNSLMRSDCWFFWGGAIFRTSVGSIALLFGECIQVPGDAMVW